MDDGKEDDGNRMFGHKARTECRKAIDRSDQLPGCSAPMLHNPYRNTGAETTGDHCRRQDEDPSIKKTALLPK